MIGPMREVDDEQRRDHPQQRVHLAGLARDDLDDDVEMKPAPMPFVIEYVNGMTTIVRNAGMAIS